uniref:DNA-directed RNA polymerase III subunit RPC8 n=1 Tax=Magallana gigas TaxID=29159 RepID=K1PF51_MAGGI
MFVLAEMKDTVRIPPWLFHIKFNDAVIEALNKKLANKVKRMTATRGDKWKAL